jgi:glycosyltransferase involved in cell wall biosynthesis
MVEATRSSSDGNHAQGPVLAVLLLSGPVFGQMLSNAMCLERIREQLPVEAFDLGPGDLKIRSSVLIWLYKALRSLWIAGRLLFGRGSHGVVYMGAHARWGLITDSAIAAAARVRRWVPIIHHRTYNYIHSRDWRMRMLCKLAGPRAIHVHLCARMAEEFVKVYGPCRTFVVANDASLVRMTERTAAPQASSSFRIGHLSNLMLEKGLGEVLDTFAALIAAGDDVSLHLAGPIMGPKERSLIDAAKMKYRERLVEHGPLYGEAKVRFYEGIDTFLFPTKYKNESWGIVLNEAMTFGVPPISVDLACVRFVVGDGGVVVNDIRSFVPDAVGVIRDWIRDDAAYRRSKENAYRRGRELREQAKLAKSRLAELVRDVAIENARNKKNRDVASTVE